MLPPRDDNINDFVSDESKQLGDNIRRQIAHLGNGLNVQREQFVCKFRLGDCCDIFSIFGDVEDRFRSWAIKVVVIVIVRITVIIVSFTTSGLDGGRLAKGAEV